VKEKEKFIFTVPLAVALLNYVTIREALPLSQIFLQTGIFHGVFSIGRQYRLSFKRPLRTGAERDQSQIVRDILSLL
jgi:hypothetical protein